MSGDPTPTAQQPEEWHAQPAEAALAHLGVSVGGLSKAEAAERLQRYGPNRLPEPPRRSVMARFFIQFHNILIYVLLVAAVITTALGHIVDSLVIFAVVVANAVIGFVQEGKAESAIEAIRQMLAPHASVIRDGNRRSVSGDEVVPGDIVILEPGDKAPADIRLLRARGLQVQEAILTGESVPVEKEPSPVASDAPLGDRACMAFSGTLVTSGQGRGVVVATGTSTEIGRIGGLLTTVETLTTPLVKQIGVFAKWLTIMILAIAALLLLFGYFVEHYSFTDMFMAVVGLSVAAIPEGLPAVLTITLAVGVQAMARRNAIVRRLPAIETLGSVSVICTDKTGTLTRNEMMVTSVAVDAELLQVAGVGYEPTGDITRAASGAPTDSAGSLLKELAFAAVLCNDSQLRHHNGVWLVEGDPMEGALLAMAGKAGADAEAVQLAWARTDEIPFDARHRYMATLSHDHQHNAVITVKGAPERILAMCGDQRTPGGACEALDEPFWRQRASEIASLGQRVLAIAVRSVEPEHTVLEASDVERDLTLLGLVGLIDPPRGEAIDAVEDCHTAGIRVKMITGDHAATAAAIGKQIGLTSPERVLTGAQIDEMDDPVLAMAVMDTDVFARTSPEHKLRLVMALQSHNMTVAMTGDGVNDAPALKRADVGVAMGKKGSEAAKEAADFVLADDNFASIAAAVREGRTVYDNIKKVISWTLPTNAAEALTILVALLFGMTLPITPIQILWVNTVTAVTLGLALAFEPTEENTMRRLPRSRNEPLLTGTLVWTILLVSTLFLCGVFGMYAYAIDRGQPVELARTLAVNTLVVMEIFYLFFIRNIYGTSLTWRKVCGTRVVWLTVALVTAAQFGITYVPAMQRVFGTEAVSLFDGLLVVGVGVVVFAIVEIEKQLRLRLRALRTI